MDKVDISAYLRPDRASRKTSDEAASREPMGDPTYSVVLGYGFARSPKPRAKEPSGRKKAD
jgi:hypothetical protein